MLVASVQKVYTMQHLERERQAEDRDRARQVGSVNRVQEVTMAASWRHNHSTYASLKYQGK